MNWDKGCVSDGGEEVGRRRGEEMGVTWRIWLGRPSGGVAVCSLKVSVAVDSWLVRGDGRYWFLRGVCWSSFWTWEEILCDRRGFLMSWSSPVLCCGRS